MKEFDQFGSVQVEIKSFRRSLIYGMPWRNRSNHFILILPPGKIRLENSETDDVLTWALLHLDALELFHFNRFLCTLLKVYLNRVFNLLCESDRNKNQIIKLLK